MTQTDYLKLKKPDPTDFYNIEDFNDNMDALDGAAKGSFFLGNGQIIPENSDLNDYLTAGVYRCPNSSYTATLQNVPENFTSGFKMAVLYGPNDSYLLQKIYGLTTYVSTRIAEYTRTYSVSLGWSEWCRTVTDGDITLSAAAPTSTLLENQIWKVYQ